MKYFIKHLGKFIGLSLILGTFLCSDNSMAASMAASAEMDSKILDMISWNRKWKEATWKRDPLNAAAWKKTTQGIKGEIETLAAAAGVDPAAEYIAVLERRRLEATIEADRMGYKGPVRENYVIARLDEGAGWEMI